jgi:putative transposase
MPRAARCVFADFPLHIVQRGISRNACFFADTDYRTYLRYLHAFSAQFGCSVHAYCLMTNHVHLLVTPHAVDACALLMKKLGQCYVQGVNQRLGRSGTLWEGRFRSCCVSTDSYALACYRYIELNPVRAGMVASPAQYRWSSYSANALGVHNELIASHGAYEALAFEPHERQRAYAELCRTPPSPLFIEEIRKATRLGGVAGRVRRSRGRPVAAK